MQVFNVTKSIETVRLEGNTVGDVLTDSHVALIVDTTSREIYIYKGNKSALVLYFIALRLAKELKRVKRGFFSIKKSIEPDLLESLRSKPITNGNSVPELKNPGLFETDEPPKAPADPSKIQDIEQDALWRERLTPKEIPVFQNIKITKNLDDLKELPDVPEFRTEMVMINTSVFSYSEDLSSFLKGRKVNRRLVKLGNLPEGYFFTEGLSSRITIKQGRVQSIELLRKESDKKTQTGRINAPVLFIPRILTERSLNLIQDAFQRPEKVSIDMLIEQAKANVQEKVVISTLER